MNEISCDITLNDILFRALKFGLKIIGFSVFLRRLKADSKTRFSARFRSVFSTFQKLLVDLLYLFEFNSLEYEWSIDDFFGIFVVALSKLRVSRFLKI